MKIIFISATLAIIYQMRYSKAIRGSYEKDRDTFRYEILVGASLVVAFVVHERIANRGFFHWVMEVRTAFNSGLT